MGCATPRVKPVAKPIAAVVTPPAPTVKPEKKEAPLVVQKGLISVVERGKQQLLLIPRSLLRKELLLHVELLQGLANDNISPGIGLDEDKANDIVVTLDRRESSVILLRRQIHLYSGDDPVLSAALSSSSSDSLIASAKIEDAPAGSIPRDSILINPRALLLGKAILIEKLLENTLKKGVERPEIDFELRPEDSQVERVVPQADGIIVYTRQTFNIDKSNVEIHGIADRRGISVQVVYNLTSLPKSPMPPREADERMGFNTVERRNLARPFQRRPEEFIHRWRLEPGEQVGALTRPRKPIVFYLDSTIPPALVPAVRDGVLAWNRAFEQAGWKDAIAVAPLPQKDEAGEMRRAIIRWVITERSLRYGQARRIVDPRTGEILGARVVLDALAIKSDYDVAQYYTLSAAPSVASVDGSTSPESEEMTQLRNALLSQGASKTLLPVLPQVLAQRLRNTVTHEVGHALGLRHNFRASSDVPVDKLSDVAWVREHGVTSSVMDYPSINMPKSLDAVSADFPFYSVGLGDADPLLIAYGYAHDETASQRAVGTFVERGFSFGTDGEDSAPYAIDPLTSKHDLGNDVLLWSRGRADLIRTLWARLPQRVLIAGRQYGELSDGVRRLSNEYFSHLELAAKYVGGQFRSRDRVSETGARLPFTPVPKEKQLAAVDLLLRYVFVDNPLQLPPTLLAQLGAQVSGPNGRLNPGPDYYAYPLYDHVHREQVSALRKLLDPLRQSRMIDGEHKFGAARILTVAELHRLVTEGLWSEAWRGGAVEIPALRRDLQRSHIEILAAQLWGGERITAHAEASALLQLTEILRHIESLSKLAALSPSTRGHLLACTTRIRGLLDPANQPRGVPLN